MRNLKSKMAVALATAAPLLANAAEPDYSVITSNAVWTGAATAVVLVIGGIAVVRAAAKGARAVIGAFR